MVRTRVRSVPVRISPGARGSRSDFVPGSDVNNVNPPAIPTHASAASAGSHVIFALQQTRRYKVVSVDNHHNSSPRALERVAKIARDALPADASPQDRDSAEIDVHTVDLTKPDQVRGVFAKYGQGGIWGVIHIAVRLSSPLPSLSTLLPSLR